MKEKLTSYAKDQLPGGCYWEPDKEVQDVLCKLSPSNDVCESILGLNDYLTTAIPNLHQMAGSNLIQVKKKQTLKWLSDLSDDKQHFIIDRAVKDRRLISKEYQSEQKARSKYRQEKMLEANTRRKALEKKLSEERDKLSQLHLFTSSDELKKELILIDEDTNNRTKMSRKKSLLRSQVQIRRKVLGQTVPIVFSTKGKQRPLNNIVNELCDFINSCTLPRECELFIQNPLSLVGKKVKHKFLEDDETPTWYLGRVLSYSSEEKTHCMKYDGEDETYDFHLTLDMILGELIIL